MGMPCSSSPSVVCVPISFNWERPQRTPPPGPFGGRWQEPGRWVGYPPWDLNWNHEEGRDQGRSPGGGPGCPLLRGSIGVVPTMGYLHEGHMSLVRRAREETSFVILTIFVNPTQFGPGEDLERYPRDLERDLEKARKAGVDLVFAPSEEEMYGPDHATWIEVEGLTEGLCGASRPGHFRGVATVVSKLFNVCHPDLAYFGQKDAQQALIVERMAADLDTGVRIVICPIVRGQDGLAVSRPFSISPR